MSGWPTHPVDSREEQEQMTYHIPRVINLYGLYSFQPWQNEIHPGILQISGPLAPQTLGTKSGQNDGEHLRESFMNRSKIQMVQKKHGEHKSQPGFMAVKYDLMILFITIHQILHNYSHSK